jgi:hypothetical protein
VVAHRLTFEDMLYKLWHYQKSNGTVTSFLKFKVLIDGAFALNKNTFCSMRFKISKHIL